MSTGRQLVKNSVVQTSTFVAEVVVMFLMTPIIIGDLGVPIYGKETTTSCSNVFASADSSYSQRLPQRSHWLQQGFIWLPHALSPSNTSLLFASVSLC